MQLVILAFLSFLLQIAANAFREHPTVILTPYSDLNQTTGGQEIKTVAMYNVELSKWIVIGLFALIGLFVIAWYCNAIIQKCIDWFLIFFQWVGSLFEWLWAFCQYKNKLATQEITEESYEAP
jgi:hypothetical protein